MVQAKPLWKWLPFVVVAVALFLVVRAPAAADGAIGPAEAAALIKQQKDLQLVDVRTPGEYAAGHLAGAKLIPLQEFEQRIAEIDRKKPVLLYCRSGNRSGTALELLRDQGVPQVKHLDGGIKAWQAAGLPVTK